MADTGLYKIMGFEFIMTMQEQDVAVTIKCFRKILAQC